MDHDSCPICQEPSIPDTQRTANAVDAVVVSNGCETHYRRAGSGAPVLLLLTAADCGAEGRLFQHLARYFRVIAPHLDTCGGDTGPALDSSEWLKGVIEGLGLWSPAVVADDGFALRALAFGLSNPGQIGRLALLVRDVQAAATSEDRAGEDETYAFEEVLEGSGRHLLLIRNPSREAADIDRCQLDRIVRFLGGEDGD